MSTGVKSFEVLEILVRHQVAFIVVGMTAGVLQGAPAVTFDLDVLHERSATNVERLLAALTELQAVFRGDERRIALNKSHLESKGHKLLMTKLGIVDVLGSLGEAEYADLLGDVVVLEVQGLRVQVLSLARLIEVKASAGRAMARGLFFYPAHSSLPASL